MRDWITSIKREKIVNTKIALACVLLAVSGPVFSDLVIIHDGMEIVERSSIGAEVWRANKNENETIHFAISGGSMGHPFHWKYSCDDAFSKELQKNTAKKLVKYIEHKDNIDMTDLIDNLGLSNCEYWD